MKYYLEKILPDKESSFFLHDEIGSVIDCIFHLHPEYELTYIVSSFGTRFVGDNISQFDAGDLVLIGPMLPHHYYNSPADSRSDTWGHARVVQFKEDFAGPGFFQLPEFRAIRKMLNDADNGMVFPLPEALAVAPLLERMTQVSPAVKLALLIEILDRLAASDYRRLSLTGAEVYPSAPDEKINRVLKYVHDAVEKNLPLSLDKAARIGCMTPPAFSRYFHKTTRKKFIDYVKEMKIGKAARLLTGTDATIAAVCFDAGFNNLANFNRQFGQVKGMTPGMFRRMFRCHQS